ncbi:MAG: alpha/beta fold hydrolase [Anaerolinea sp.]|nr:alpha/beta fold hydrolase [Anaerolinea sp.]
MLRRLLFLLLLLVLSVVPVGQTFAQSGDTADLLDDLGGEPCPDSDFTCITLTVPLDHFDKANPETLDVVFGVLPATGERYGAFVTVVGGPGSSGLLLADIYTSYFDPLVTEHYDIVFFDQRGMGLSNGLTCPEAVAAWYREPSEPTTPEGEAAFTEAARTFVDDCFVEMGEPAILPYLNTAQAVVDLEVFFKTMGYSDVVLYGESYGTQFAQTYAAAYPERLTTLILDGVVDLTLTGEEFYRQQTAAFAEALTATLEACNADPVCAADFDGDAVAVYDRIAGVLAGGALLVTFPTADGSPAFRNFSLNDLEAAAVSAVYGRGARADFLRALAAYYHRNAVPLMRLAYDALALDSSTLEVIPDDAYSDAMYYAVDCSDYQFYTGTPEERAAQYLAAGDAVAAEVPRLANAFYSDFPCVFWSVSGAPERPAYLTGEGYTTFVLVSDIDPATPYENGVAVYEHLEDAYLIVMRGGQHVILGYGDLCPDQAITDFMIDGITPIEREFLCGDDSVFHDYLPLTDPASFADPYAFIDALDTELYLYLPEYYSWSGDEPLTVGCDYGGAVTFELFEDGSGESVSFADCEHFSGIVVNGGGEYIYDETMTYNVNVSGTVTGDLYAIYDLAADMVHVDGTYNGQEVIP